MAVELGIKDPYDAPFFPSEFVFKQKHEHKDVEENVWSRGGDIGVEYVFTIEPGDIFKCWR